MTNATDHTMTEPERPDPPASAPSSAPEATAAVGTPAVDTPAVDRLLLAVTAVAVVVGVALRFAPRSGLWLDEALSVNIASLPISDIPSALRRDGHPPLFYVLLHLWSTIGSDTDWWVRAMSGVFSVITLPLMFFAGQRVAERHGAGPLGARRTGLVAVAVTAVMPFGVRYGAEARMYALVIMLAAGGYLLVDDLLRARRAGRQRVLVTVGVAVVTAALLWTHYWSMWLLAAVGLLALWRAWRDPDAARRAGARLVVAALVVGGILFLPWISALLYQSSHTGTPWGEEYGPASVIVFTVVDFAGAKYGIAHLFTYLLVPLILLAALARIQRVPRVRGNGAAADDGPEIARADNEPDDSERADDEQVVLTTAVVPRVRNELVVLGLTLAIGWAAAAASGNTFSSRYASVVYPLFLLCVAAGIAVLRRPLPTAVVLALVVAAGSVGALGAASGDRSQNGEIARAIVEDAATVEGPAVVISCPDQLGVSLQRELGHRGADEVGLGDVIPYPTGGDPDFVDWVDYGDRNASSSPEAFIEQIADRVPADATVYLVTSPTYRTFEGQCEALTTLLSQDRDPTAAVEIDDSGIDESGALWILRPRA